MKHKISATRSALVREIEELQKATSANLKERWRALYGSAAPRRISRDLLIRALAYRIQERALGGLKPSTRRLLAKVAADVSARRPIQVAPEPSLKPGTVLLREWHGSEHQVIVRENGIVFQGKTVQVVVAGRLPNHRHQVVGAALLRTEGPTRQEHIDGTV